MFVRLIAKMYPKLGNICTSQAKLAHVQKGKSNFVNGARNSHCQSQPVQEVAIAS